MIIRFRTKTLQRQYEHFSVSQRAFGDEIARKYIQRVNIIKSAKSLNDLIQIRALHCHQLKGRRKGQWAMKLTGFVRLIFSLEGDRLEIVCIEEVSKHYGK